MMLVRQFIVFVFFGSVAAMANFLSRIALSYYFDYTLSIILAYIIGMIVAFFLFKQLVFKSGIKLTSAMLFYFIVINMFGLALTLLTTLLFYSYVFSFVANDVFREGISHFVGISAPTITSYFGHKHLTFRDAS